MLKKVLISAMALSLASPAMADAPVRDGTILYKLNDNLNQSQLKQFNALLKAQGFMNERVLNGMQTRIAKFAFPGQEKIIAKLLERSGLVEFAEVDRLVPLALTPNDTYYSYQWHHSAINSPQAWDTTTGEQNVLVAVCDTGVDTDHPDLINNLRLDLAHDVVNNNSNVEDAHGHGTGVIGSLGAIGNNSTGAAGINWQIDVMPLQINISDSNSSAYLSDMAACVEYAADQGARVVNVSYGGADSNTMNNAGAYLRDRNGVLFMAAGNDSRQQNYTDHDNIVVVGATEQNNQRADFSNYGNYIDIVAPGQDIVTTYTDAGYVYYSGTSFASPIAAGVAGLMVAANPNITAEQIQTGLFNTTKDLGSEGDDNVFGKGLIDAAAAVNYAQNLNNNFPPIAVINVNSTNQEVGAIFNFNANDSSDQDGNIVSYAWDFGDGNNSTQTNPQHSYTAAGEYTVTLTVTDDKGDSGSESITLTVKAVTPAPEPEPTPEPDPTPEPEPEPTILNAPSNLDASYSRSSRSVSLTWTDNSTGEDGFVIKRVKSSWFSSRTDFITVPADSETYIDQPGRGTYTYSIQAFKDGQTSDSSNGVRIRVR